MAGLEAALVEIGDTALAREAQGAVWWHQVMDETMGLVDKTARGEGPTGLKTGLVDLDKVIGGLFAGELVILAGATSMGKTALAKQIAATVAQAGTPVLYHSLEMDGKQLAMRDMAAQAGVPLPAMRSGRLTDADLDAAMEAGTRRRALPILIDSRAGLDVGRLYAQARQTVARQNIGLIVVDYLQLLSPGQRYAGNRAAEVGEVSRALKRTARDLQVPVLAMSQLSRQVDSRDDNRPRLSDMRESGTIEQDADAVWLIYREEYYLKRKAPERGGFKSDSAYEEANASHQAKVDAARNKAELMVAKQRNGPTGTVKLRFDGARLRFENLDQNHHGEF